MTTGLGLMLFGAFLVGLGLGAWLGWSLRDG